MSVRLHSLLALVFLILVSTSPAQRAGARPNFTGIWNLDKQKSDFGGLEPPLAARYLIRHLGGKLELQYEEGTHTTRTDVIPDGQEHVLETMPESENLARVYWSGDELVFEGRIKPLANSQTPEVKYVSRWSLSPDKNVLTIDRRMSTDQASVHQRVVFVKQPIAKK